MKTLLLFSICLLTQLSTFSQGKSPEIVIKGNDTLILITIPQAKECIDYKYENVELREILLIYETVMIPEYEKGFVIRESLISISEQETEIEREKFEKAMKQLEEEREYCTHEKKKLKRARNIFGGISVILATLLIIK